MTKVIAVSNFKGGVGKTTLARELPDELSFNGLYSVAVCDLNREIMGLERFHRNRKKRKIADESGEKFSLGGPRLITFRPSTVMDVEIRFQEDVQALSRIVETARSNSFDFLFFDCPGMDADYVFAAHRLADHIITPIQMRGGDYAGFVNEVDWLSFSREARASAISSFPGTYAGMVRDAIDQNSGETAWTVVSSMLRPTDDPRIADKLGKLQGDPKFGFRFMHGLKDRTIYHATYEAGLTLAACENLEAARELDPKMTDQKFAEAKAELAAIADHILSEKHQLSLPAA